MRIDWRRAARRQLGERDSLVVLWRDREGPPGGREALVLVATACDNPECDCTDVTLDGLLVLDPFTDVRCEGEKLLIRHDARPAEPMRHVTFTVRIEQGDVPSAEVPKGMAADLTAWVQAGLDDELLDFLHGRAAAVKRWDPAAPDRDPDRWGWWEPGALVAHGEVFPEARHDAYIVDGKEVLALLHGCATPDCDCTDASVAFAEIPAESAGAGAEPRTLGRVIFDLQEERLAGDPEFHDVVDGYAAFLGRAWEAFRRRHRDLERLRRRALAIRRFGATFLMPQWESREARARTALAAAAAPARTKVGPNERCPCGSGRKYKKCCGAVPART